MIEAFKEYVKTYDLNIPEIKSKYDHSYRVMALNRKYARELGLSSDDIELATIIGILHDIGRFEQFKRYRSYIDRDTMDHAEYGVLELFDHGKIRNFTNKVEDYPIIKFAIRNHNKYKIPECDDERMMLHSKLIKDSDRVDIIFFLGYLGEFGHKADQSEISKEVIKDIFNHRQVDRKNVKTNNDNIAIHFGFAFDIYNDICLKKMKENLSYYYKRIEGEEKFKDIYNEVMNYIDERIGKNVR